MKKTPAELRKEIVQIIRSEAKERFSEGDPEGSGVIADLAKRIAKLRLTKP